MNDDDRFGFYDHGGRRAVAALLCGNRNGRLSFRYSNDSTLRIDFSDGRIRYLPYEIAVGGLGRCDDSRDERCVRRINI